VTSWSLTASHTRTGCMSSSSPPPAAVRRHHASLPVRGCTNVCNAVGCHRKSTTHDHAGCISMQAAVSATFPAPLLLLSLQCSTHTHSYLTLLCTAHAPSRLNMYAVPCAVCTDCYGVDIGPATAQLFAEALGQCSTVFWNGPMGKFEVSQGSFHSCSASVPFE
jgi:hypothetical protein